MKMTAFKSLAAAFALGALTLVQAPALAQDATLKAVSYTHLDVYKRQRLADPWHAAAGAAVRDLLRPAQRRRGARPAAGGADRLHAERRRLQFRSDPRRHRVDLARPVGCLLYTSAMCRLVEAGVGVGIVPETTAHLSLIHI